MKEVVLSVTFFLPMYNVFTFVCKFSACLHLLNSFYFFFSFIYHSISFSRYFYLLIRRHIYMLLFYHPYSYDPPHVYRWNNAFVSFTFKIYFPSYITPSIYSHQWVSTTTHYVVSFKRLRSMHL